MSDVLAIILQPNDDNIKECATYIKNGGIVGMPTETVYGLAANAFDVSACEKIFTYKGRPLTDPLIVHVCSMEMALQITEMDANTNELFTLLTNKFWPGPLTIVLKANLNLISRKILANADTVGIRYPVHEVAQKLIKESGVPIAAPSANKFCHISPVNPYHVFDDFKMFPVKILNGGVCNFCMESTVIKIDALHNKIIIFRMGAISALDIQNVLNTNNKFKDYAIECIAKNVNVKEKVMLQIKHNNNNMKEDNELTLNQDAPGQFVKHYSPQIETYVCTDENDYIKEIKLSNDIVFIDYMGILYKKYKDVLTDKDSYLELSENGDENEVMKNFYNYLRKAEVIEGKKVIVICDIDIHMKDNHHKFTLLDRMWKACAFKKIKIIL